jgi:hypothetical protein
VGGQPMPAAAVSVKGARRVSATHPRPAPGDARRNSAVLRDSAENADRLGRRGRLGNRASLRTSSEKSNCHGHSQSVGFRTRISIECKRTDDVPSDSESAMGQSILTATSPPNASRARPVVCACVIGRRARCLSAPKRHPNPGCAPSIRAELGNRHVGTATVRTT